MNLIMTYSRTNLDQDSLGTLPRRSLESKGLNHCEIVATIEF